MLRRTGLQSRSRTGGVDYRRTRRGSIRGPPRRVGEQRRDIHRRCDAPTAQGRVRLLSAGSADAASRASLDDDQDAATGGDTAPIAQVADAQVFMAVKDTAPEALPAHTSRSAALEEGGGADLLRW